MSAFSESEERQELRKEVARLASKYGASTSPSRPAAAARPPTCGWRWARTATSASTSPRSTAAGVAASATSPRSARSCGAGCPLLMMVVSPAICGTVIARYGTEEQKHRWLPGIADGTGTMAFAITEPDAGSNSHNITTTARRDGDE